MDRNLAHTTAGADLVRVAHQLGYRIILFWSDGKTRQDLGLQGLPHPHFCGSDSAVALDRASLAGTTALACRQWRYLCALGLYFSGRPVHVVGPHSPRTLLV